MVGNERGRLPMKPRKKHQKKLPTGLRKFEQYFGKPVDEILKLREQDLNSNNIHQKRRFEKEIKIFHQSLLEKEYRINEPQPTAKIPSLEKGLDLVMEVQKQDLLEKVKKIWNEKYGEFSFSLTGETMRMQPDFDNMTPREIHKKYLELLKEKRWMMVKRKKESEKEGQTWTCPICGEENHTGEDICYGCGCLIRETCYDAISDEMDEE